MTDQVKAPKTLAQQLADAEARVAKLRQAILAEALVNRVAPGQDVEFSFGRGEKARTLRGVIKGVREEEKVGKVAAVFVSSEDGFSDQTYRVRLSEISRNYTIEAEDAASADASTDADPLAND